MRINIHQQRQWVQILLHASRHIDNQISDAGRHSSRVAFWVRMLAIEMGVSPRDTRTFHWAALLHDIGKLGVPDAVLSKAGPLDDQEWSLIKLHPTIGASMVRSMNGISRIAPIVMSHQEKYDGSGYPYGLKAEKIPLGGRILAVADAYDAMTNDRVYRKARNHSDAVYELKTLSGTHFDPHVVGSFIRLLQ